MKQDPIRHQEDFSRTGDLDNRSSDLVDAMSEALGKSEFPDLKSIICAFTRRCGGAEGVAKMLMKEYREAKPGTMIRSMILQMILHGSKTISAKTQARDESMLSDADIDKEVQTIMNNALKTGKYGKTDAAQPRPPEGVGENPPTPAG